MPRGFIRGWVALAISVLAAVAAPSAMAAPVIDTYAGGGNGDGSLAINAIIDPAGLIAVGSSSSPDFYIADARNDRVRRVDGTTGLIETIAGNGVHGYGGDGGSAVNASLSLPLDVALDSAGNVYIADMQNNRIRKVTPNGQISTFAGSGMLGYGGDGGLATQAALYNPYSVAFGPDGYIYIADYGNNRIRRVGPPGCTPSTCVINTVVGTGASGFAGDGNPAASASLKNPADVTFDDNGNMLIADWGNHRIRKVVNGIISTVAGGGLSTNGSIGDGGPATSGNLIFPTQVTADDAGNLFIADSGHRLVRMVQASNQFIYTAAGNGGAGTTGDGGPAPAATLYWTYGVVATTAGNFWLSQSENVARSQHNRVRHVINGIINTVIGGGLGDGGPAYDARVEPAGAEAKSGQGSTPDLYFADSGNNVVRYVNGATADIFNVAGTGTAGYSGDNGPALQATLFGPNDVAVDDAGTVYIADTNNNVVRRVRDGIIQTVAGVGRPGFSGDGGSAASAQLSSPTGVAVDSLGRLYIADNANNRIRRVSNGIISTIAGNGTQGSGGDGGPATSANLKNPWDMVVADNGTIFVADSWNHRIRAIDPNGIITTYAGLGYSGFSGDGGPASLALFYVPTGIDLDGTGNVYVNDSRNQRVRMIDTSAQHIITTVAGNGTHGYSGDGGPATSASFSDPTGIAVDPRGQKLFISSDFDNRVRIVSFDSSAPPTATFTATPIPPTPTFTATPIPPTPTFTAPAPQATPTRTGTFTRTPTKTATPPNASIFGAVTYYSNNQVVPSVNVQLTGPSMVTVQTNAQGQYSASLPQDTWNVQPAKTGGFGTAVSSLDAARVLQSLTGAQRFTAQQRLACDATGDGTISTLDAVYILQFSAGLIDQLPAARMCGSDWLFYPNPATAPNQATVLPSLSAGVCQQGAIILNPLTGSVDGQNFGGILLGDCTGNWTAGAAALRQRTAGSAIVHAGTPRQGPGTRFTVPVYVKSATPFQAMDLRLHFDPSATFVGATTRGDAAGAITSSQADNGELSLSMASGTPIAGSHGAILLLQFRGANPSLALEGAMIDEQLAGVVTHRQSR